MTYERKLARAIADADLDMLEKLFEEIYYKYGKLVGFIISKYVPDKEDIEELTNDVFVNFSKALGRIELDNIKYYLVVQAKNSAINFVKKKTNRQETVYVEKVDAGEVDRDDQTPYYELLEDLRQYLTEDEVNIVVLHSVYEESFVEIGKRFGRPTTTVKSTYHRALAKYRKEKGIVL